VIGAILSAVEAWLKLKIREWEVKIADLDRGDKTLEELAAGGATLSDMDRMMALQERSNRLGTPYSGFMP
jgi:hypothetical protein